MANSIDKGKNNSRVIYYGSTRANRVKSAERQAPQKRKHKLLGSAAVVLAAASLLSGIAGKSLAEAENINPKHEKIEHVQKKEFQKPYPKYELSKSAKSQIKTQLPRINDLMPLYKQAAKKTDMPWQVIAAIHYEEANNDPDMSAFAGESLGSVNPDGQGENGYAPATQLENYIAALNHARTMGEGVYGVDIDKHTKDLDTLGKMFVAYNRGYIYKNAGLSHKDSPYAYSGLSKNDQEFSNVFPNADPLAGQVDNRPGALAVMVYLTRFETKHEQEQ